ncbi:MAG: type I-E CRISPR-associated endoribonuclease Cas2e [Armatimonadota bacterium]|nr:type I-E CRISPR-associated endoribonuclease Cas2e [Armatimonadota bacterium]
MVVLILERVPKSLRGELTRWMVEVDTGMFVGKLSATVRELLWVKCLEKAKGGRCCLVHRTNTEQGFSVRVAGYEDRFVRDFDGLQLVTVRNAEAVRKGEAIKRRKYLEKQIARRSEVG